MRERLRQEDGIALLLALGFTVALSLLVFGMTSFVTSNQHNAQNSNNDQIARSYAESALQTAYSRIVYANTSAGTLAGLSPSKPTLLGCGGSNADGSSNCATVTPMCLGFVQSCPGGAYTATAGTATVSGAFTGTSTTTSYAGLAGLASQWLIVATGYSRNASGKVVSKTLRGTVTVSGADSGAVASVWNHVFVTAPLAAGVCQVSFSANTTTLDAPLYVIGNLCFMGNTVGLAEVAGGQQVDLQVGGRLVYGGNGDFVGTSTKSITSGIVVGGCAKLITGATTACVDGAANSPTYKVGSVGSFTSQQDPELSDAQAMSNYSNFDPGPKHPCLTGTTPSPLTTSQLDFTIAAGEGTTVLPGNSGSGSSGGVFDLTPASSYACISTSGTSTGYLIWNNGGSSLTVSGITVPSKTLAINGSIYIDAPFKISQSMAYQGTAVIMGSGQISFPTNGETICAINTSCTFSNWQGNTGHNDMMTLATILKNSATAINWSGNSITFQASLWCSPTSTFYLNGQGSPQIQGPMSVGSINVVGNSFSFKPLPVIKNMPVGAPVPPNVSATISPLNVIG